MQKRCRVGCKSLFLLSMSILLAGCAKGEQAVVVKTATSEAIAAAESTETLELEAAEKGWLTIQATGEKIPMVPSNTEVLLELLSENNLVEDNGESGLSSACIVFLFDEYLFQYQKQELGINQEYVTVYDGGEIERYRFKDQESADTCAQILGAYKDYHQNITFEAGELEEVTCETTTGEVQPLAEEMILELVETLNQKEPQQVLEEPGEIKNKIQLTLKNG